jgi:hypothetical protein
MRNKPARRFRQPQAHRKNNEAECRADEKSQSPSKIGRKDRGVEQHDRTGRAHVPEAGAPPMHDHCDLICPDLPGRAPVARAE